jgi:hypothetical protein
MGDLEEKGQLSNPVQRRLYQGVIDELAHLYEEGASIDALARKYESTGPRSSLNSIGEA